MNFIQKKLTQSNELRYWVLQFLGWLILSVSLLILYKVLDVKISNERLLGNLAILFFGGIIFTHLLKLFIKWRKWMSEPIKTVLPKLAIATVICTTAYAAFDSWLVEFLGIGNPKMKNLSYFSKIVARLVNHLLFFIPWTLIYFIYHVVDRYQRQQINTLKLESLIKELELNSIKSRVNPHFIFNSLNSIRALVDENPKRARRAITELSNILRSSLLMEKQKTTSFENELSIVKDYLELESIRFEERLHIKMDVEENTLSHQVPPMMVQTLVENSIKHGISKQKSGGLINIISKKENNYLDIIIQNTGKLNGYKSKEGFGIKGTENRLKLLYGELAVFKIHQLEENVVEVELKIPTQPND